MRMETDQQNPGMAVSKFLLGEITAIPYDNICLLQ